MVGLGLPCLIGDQTSWTSLAATLRTLSEPNDAIVIQDRWSTVFGYQPWQSAQRAGSSAGRHGLLKGRRICRILRHRQLAYQSIYDPTNHPFRSRLGPGPRALGFRRVGPEPGSVQNKRAAPSTLTARLRPGKRSRRTGREVKGRGTRYSCATCGVEKCHEE